MVKRILYPTFVWTIVASVYALAWAHADGDSVERTYWAADDTVSALVENYGEGASPAALDGADDGAGPADDAAVTSIYDAADGLE